MGDYSEQCCFIGFFSPINPAVEQNEVTETTGKETKTLVHVERVNKKKKKTERGKKMKYMKTWYKLNTMGKVA